MKLILSLLTSFLLLTNPVISHAEYQFGVMPSFNLYNIESEKNISVDGFFNIQNFFASIDIGRDQRAWFDFAKSDIEQNAQAGEQAIYGDATRFTLNYQKKFRLARNFKPWIGGGLNYSTLNIDRSFLLDDEGFLFQSLDSSSSSDIGLNLQAVFEFKPFIKDIGALVSLDYLHSFGKNINGIRLGIGFYYR